MAKNIVIFGATGSVGRSSINVLRRNREKINIVGIAANSNVEKLSEIAHEFNVQNIGIGDPKSLIGKEHFFYKNTKFFLGDEGLCELAQLKGSDSILMAIDCAKGISMTLAGIRAKKDILLASKEVLVVAGKYVMEEASNNGVNILPVDSEHNAIFQCLHGEKKEDIERLILTASGGPFRKFSKDELEHVTVEQALKHPTWNMGKKITIDSSTMANKGFEIIEAHWLFGVQPDKIDVVVHPESIIHSMVEFKDHSIIAQMCPTNMEFPIENCLFFPNRNKNTLQGLDFSHLPTITFETPDIEKFPCLKIAKDCLSSDGNACAVFQAADEAAVDLFLQKKIRFTQIADIIKSTLDTYSCEKNESLEDSLITLNKAKKIASDIACHLCNSR